MSKYIEINGYVNFSIGPANHSWQRTLNYEIENPEGNIKGSIVLLYHMHFSFNFNYRTSLNVEKKMFAAVINQLTDFNGGEFPLIIFHSENEDIVNKCFIELRKTLSC